PMSLIEPEKTRTWLFCRRTVMLVSTSKIICQLLIVTTAILGPRDISSQNLKSRSVQPRQVPESVTSRLLCGVVAPPSADSKDAGKAGVESDRKGCGSTPMPVYPESAKRAGVQGKVALEAVIGKDGVIKSLKVIHGDPLLTDAALDAAKRWKYKPY